MLVSFFIIRELDPPQRLTSPFAPTVQKASGLIAKRFQCKRGKHNCHFHLSHSDQSSLGYQHSNRDFCLQLVLLITVCQQDSGCSSQEFLAAHTNHLPTSSLTVFEDALCLTGFPCSALNRIVQHKVNLHISSINNTKRIR